VEAAGRRLAATAESRVRAPVVRSRLLVSLANPATVVPLVDLALLAREPGPTEPLIVVTAVGGGADREAEVLRGERLLSAAVVHAAGASVPVLPLVRTEANVARALARAATETRTTTLVMGWDGGAAAERLLFGSITDRVLRETAASVLIARLTQPLCTVGRLVVAVPPLAELEPGFERAARLLSGLATRAGASLVLLTPAPYREAAGAAFARAARGALPHAFDLAAWGDLPAALDAMLRPSDALALISARQGAVAWRASLDRLPRGLARRFSDVPLFVLYPGQVPVSSILPSELTSGERGFLDRFGPDQIRIGLSPGPIDALLRQTLERASPASSQAAVLQALLATLLDARHEIRPGVVLAHAHTEAVERPLFAVGLSREGLAVPGASGAVFVVAVLTVPERVPSATYLRWLALVARMLRDDVTLETLRRAETPEAARSILLATFYAPEDPPPEGETMLTG
jgi:mannitol/fructose-specific phosphotransferase system IIA component (Ntr-type)/nucleotide-binding universal stress UspA family protein